MKLRADTHGASPVAVHSEVRAEEQVGNGQEQRLGQRSSSVIVIQLIRLEKGNLCMRLGTDRMGALLLLFTELNNR